MSNVTHILSAIEQGDPQAAEQLLPLVYDELRELAAARLAAEKSGQTLQPTALVHEAYLRLVGGSPPRDWNSRGHFFAAAAEAMRRILVDSARRKRRPKHGESCRGTEGGTCSAGRSKPRRSQRRSHRWTCSRSMRHWNDSTKLMRRRRKICPQVSRTRLRGSRAPRSY